MNKIRFGPSGNEECFYADGNKHSTQAPLWLKNKGLNAYEFSFGRGINISEETAKLIGENAKENDVLVSAHAPYYINLANPNEEMIQKSFAYIEKGLKMLECFNGRDYVVHVGSCGKLERSVAINLVKTNLKRAIEIVKEKGLLNGKFICPETMGKPLQIGTYEEIIDLCTIDDCLIPTFDFGHINALGGGCLKTYDDYKKIFELAINKLGERAKSCHIHFSKIEYGNKGEIRHLNYDDEIYGPDFLPLAKVIKDLNLTPTIICESKDKMMTDCLTLKSIYENIL